MQLDHVGQRAGRETCRCAFQQHARKDLTASQRVVMTIVIGRQDKHLRVISIELRTTVAEAVLREGAGHVDAVRFFTRGHRAGGDAVVGDGTLRPPI